MIALVDTSSLVSLVRYYLHHDKNNKLLTYIENKLKQKEILVLDKVCTESEYIAKGIVLQKMPFLKDYKISTKDLLPSRKYFNRLENEFCYGAIKNLLSEAEFETKKNEYLETPDAKLVLYWLQNNASFVQEKLAIITEETVSENDKKIFKKLPAICDILQIEHHTLPELMNTFQDFAIIFNHSTKTT